MVNPNLYLADFLKTNLAKFAAIRVKKDQKTPDKLENNHTSEAERNLGEIQKKAKLGGRKEEKRKTRKC